MQRQSLLFTAPRQVCLQTEDLPEPQGDQLLVQTVLTAISPGTEMLVYRGQFPTGQAVDESISALEGQFAYPLKYGYSSVGRVSAAGPQAPADWLGSLVFAFQPHESAFIARHTGLLRVPDGMPAERAVFLPNMETAVNFVMDGSPVIGEQVAVFGQGIVGLLTTALLSRFPLAGLVTLDRFAQRRQASLSLGASASLDPGDEGGLRALEQAQPGGADLVYELSGAPAALDQAIAAARFNGRVVIGSWYGEKRASLDLGGRFHRSRIRLLSSQVSTLNPELSGRWTKERRMQVAWEMLDVVQPERLITQTFPFERAAEAFSLVDERPGESIQVVLDYR